MIDDGLFVKFPVDAVFGIHNWPGMPAGHFGVTRRADHGVEQRVSH